MTIVDGAGSDYFPKVTERFLAGLAGVAKASAWIEKGNLFAAVTLVGEAYEDPVQLREACLEELGSEFTPRMILVDRALRPAA